MGECYICTLETCELSNCKCKNLFLHKKCKINLVNLTNTTTCSICNQEYDDIDLIIESINKMKIRQMIINMLIETIIRLLLFILFIIFINHLIYDKSI